MIRPLIIAPHFLFENVTNGQLERTFVSNLPDNYYPTIVCEKPPKGQDIKHIDGLDVYPVKRNAITNAFQGVCERLHCCSMLSVPDRDRFSCVPQALNVVNHLFKENQFDYIHTISMPCSSHIIGNYIKSNYNIPWVAQFYDPWQGNPTRHLCGHAAQTDRNLEKTVAEKADVIIQPNESLKAFWANLYGDVIANKIKILPFIANVDKTGSHILQNKEKLIITHIGGLSKDRNTSVFLKGLKKCVCEHPGVRNKVTVKYVGDITSVEEEYIKANNLNDVVQYIGRLPELQCEKYYEEADIFLIVDLNCTPNLFYPSKLVKYFCYSKPILGLVIEGGTVQHELSITKNHPFGYYDIDGISDFIYKAISKYSSICTNDSKYKEVFQRDNVLRQYDNFIMSMLK